VASKEVAVKKYVVRLSEEERARLGEFVRKGKRAGHLLTKARILLKADVSEAGEGWSDSRIAEALDTSIPTVERTRRQLVEEGFEAVLTRKYNPNSAPRRIFHGAAEAKLIALACGPAPAGRAKMDPASPRGEGRRTANRRERRRQNDRADAQKNCRVWGDHFN